MLQEIRKEVVPIIIVVALLVAAMRYWLTGESIPDDLSILVTSIVSLYFGGRVGGAAATRALNGAATTVVAVEPGGTPGGNPSH